MEIKNRKGEVIYHIDGDSLIGADLSCVDLTGAVFRNVNLESAHLIAANLTGSDLIRAFLGGADLRDVNFQGARLTGADLTAVNLVDANLENADLKRANLKGADLRYANLKGVNLEGANLTGANLRYANLEGVKYNEYTSFFALIPPEDGEFVAWKKVDEYIVKLQIPADAKRSSATSRKCRSSKALVLGIYDMDKNLTSEKKVTSHNFKTTDYIVGCMVEADSWDDDRWNACSRGIHFFMTFDEAKNYENTLYKKSSKQQN